MMYDLIVVGGGSAGMAAAIQGALLGLRVVVFDRQGRDFDKPCGEGLMAPAVAALHRLGVVLEDAMPFSGVRYFVNGSVISASFLPHRGGLGVRRLTLRRATWDRALQLGVEICHQRVQSLSQSEEFVEVEGVRGRWLCLATGQSKQLLTPLGFPFEPKHRPKILRTGLRRHVSVLPWSPTVDVYWHDRFEVYVTPVSANCVNIAVLSSKPVAFQDAVDATPDLRRRLVGAEWIDAVGGISPLYHRSKSLQRGRVMLAGDVAGFIDAMTGEGNALAIQAGINAASSIKAGRVLSYSRCWRSITWRYRFVTTIALRFTQFQVGRRLWLGTLMRWPRLLQFGLRFLAAVKEN